MVRRIVLRGRDPEMRVPTSATVLRPTGHRRRTTAAARTIRERITTIGPTHLPRTTGTADILRHGPIARHVAIRDMAATLLHGPIRHLAVMAEADPIAAVMAVGAVALTVAAVAASTVVEAAAVVSTAVGAEVEARTVAAEAATAVGADTTKISSTL